MPGRGDVVPSIKRNNPGKISGLFLFLRAFAAKFLAQKLRNNRREL
jgi:hypothetical protein